ncbi:MAG: sterol desaturase family protein [Myxococcota bacterium]
MTSSPHTWLVAVAALLGFFVVRTVVLVGGATLALRTAWAGFRRVYRVPFAKGQWASEFKAAVTVILFDALVVGTALSLEVWTFAPVTPAATAWTWAVMFVWYEVWFYAVHRALHTRALYRFHAQHHVAKVTGPLTSLSFGLIERAVLLLGAVGASAALSRVMPISPAGVMAYFFSNYVLNIWGHANVEVLPEGFPRTWWGRLFISTSFHAMHHARYQGHYGLFTQVLDRLFGTYWDDYPEVHARAARGEGLTRLGERAKGRDAAARPSRTDTTPGAVRLEEAIRARHDG